MAKLEDLILCCVHSKGTDSTKGVVIIPYHRVHEYMVQLKKGDKKPADINIFDEGAPTNFRSPLSIAQITREHYFATSRVGVHAIKRHGDNRHRQVFNFLDTNEIFRLVGKVSTPETKDELKSVFSEFGDAYGAKVKSNYSFMTKVSDGIFLLSIYVENRLGEEHRTETTYSGLATFLCKFKEGLDISELFTEGASLNEIFEISHLRYKPTRDTRIIITNQKKYLAIPETCKLTVYKCDERKDIVNFQEPIYIFNFGLDKKREEIIDYDVKDNIAAAVLLHKGKNNQLSYSIEIKNESGSRSYRLTQDNPNSILERPRSIKLIRHKNEEGEERLYCLVGCYRGAVYTIDCGTDLEEAAVTNINGFLTLDKRIRSSGNSEKHSVKQITQGKDGDVVLCCSDLLFKVSPRYFIENSVGTYEDGDRIDNYIVRTQLAHRCVKMLIDCNQ